MLKFGILKLGKYVLSSESMGKSNVERIDITDNNIGACPRINESKRPLIK
jgi:hypothetical protein